MTNSVVSKSFFRNCFIAILKIERIASHGYGGTRLFHLYSKRSCPAHDSSHCVKVSFLILCIKVHSEHDALVLAHPHTVSKSSRHFCAKLNVRNIESYPREQKLQRHEFNQSAVDFKRNSRATTAKAAAMYGSARSSKRT